MPTFAKAMDWDLYWSKAALPERRGFYQRIAKLYRDQIISRSAARILARLFPDDPSRRYLHAGCGSGGSDQRIPLTRCRFHFLDLSPVAIRLHRGQAMGIRRQYLCGDIFRLPYTDGCMDGIFNFGVMEHFTQSQIGQILAEFHRVLKDGGRAVLFWPPEFGLSVLVLSNFLRVVNAFRKQPLTLYPDEISRIQSFGWVRELMQRSRFHVLSTEFGPGDLFTYVAVVAEKARGIAETGELER